jgi:hypothetical protein
VSVTSAACYRARMRKHPISKVIHAIGTRMTKAMPQGMRAASTMTLLMCTKEELTVHLEERFTDGMSWDNYGKKDGMWQVDHIIPIAAFDLSDAQQQRMCFWYLNLQPLLKLDNLLKGDEYTAEGYAANEAAYGDQREVSALHQPVLKVCQSIDKFS